MKTVNRTLKLNTTKRCQMRDITGQVASIVSDSGITDGLVTVFCPHTTAAITINENTDPAVVHDILMTLEEILPQHRRGYRHGEGNSDAHIKSSLLCSSQTVIINDGKMQLGRWQGIYFCEFDGPRSRKVNVQAAG